MPTVTQKRLYSNDNMPTALTTAYTAPTSTQAIITCITIANKTAVSHGTLIKVGGVTLIPITTLHGENSTTIIQLSTIINATETIQVQADTANAIAITISGVEVV